MTQLRQATCMSPNAETWIQTSQW